MEHAGGYAPRVSDAPDLPEASDAESPAGEPSAQAALQAAQAAFERGDFREVRRLTEPLAEAPDTDIARAALELRRRTGIDPVQIGVLLFCLGLFAWVAWKYVLST